MAQVVLIEQILQVVDAALGGFLGVGDQQPGIHLTHEQQGIGDEQHRWRIEDDEIVVGSQLLQERVEAVVHHQLGCVGRNRSSGDDRQGVHRSCLPHFLDFTTSDEVGAQSDLIRKLEVLVHLGFVHVKIHKYHLFPGLRQYGREIGRHE